MKHNTFAHGTSVPAWNRALLAVLTLALVTTSTHVEIAGASTVPVMKAVKADMIQVSEPNTGDLKAPSTFTSELPKAKDVVTPKVQERKKWNTTNAPDLTTQPEYSSEPALRTMVVPTTAYTSDPGETDSTPFTTADGSQVRDGIVAANFLPHGTRIRIPDYFGNKVFEVHDRMNKRYQTRVDVWMTNKTDAYAWGVRNVKIEILP
ncbi:MAG: 3D domain-containing protein [bacterium]|nr:3D domain-containing protein [bacterium]